MPLVLPTTIMEAGVLGAAMIIIYRLVGVVATVVLQKKGLNPQPSSVFTPLQARLLEEVHQLTEKTEREKAEGKFSCAWRGRDEVLKSLALQERMLDALKLNTQALNLLAQEFRLSRRNNGS